MQPLMHCTHTLISLSRFMPVIAAKLRPPSGQLVRPRVGGVFHNRRSQAPGSARAEACKRAFAVSHDLSRGSATANSWSHELPSRSGLNFQWSMAKQTQIEGESEHCARVNCESRASPLRSFLSPPPTSLSPEGWSYRYGPHVLTPS